MPCGQCFGLSSPHRSIVWSIYAKHVKTFGVYPYPTGHFSSVSLCLCTLTSLCCLSMPRMSIFFRLSMPCSQGLTPSMQLVLVSLSSSHFSGSVDVGTLSMLGLFSPHKSILFNSFRQTCENVLGCIYALPVNFFVVSLCLTGHFSSVFLCLRGHLVGVHLPDRSMFLVSPCLCRSLFGDYPCLAVNVFDSLRLTGQCFGRSTSNM